MTCVGHAGQEPIVETFALCLDQLHSTLGMQQSTPRSGSTSKRSYSQQANYKPHLQRCSPFAGSGGPKLQALPRAVTAASLHCPVQLPFFLPLLGLASLPSLLPLSLLLQLPQVLPPDLPLDDAPAPCRGELQLLLLPLQKMLRNPKICACCSGVKLSRASKLSERMLPHSCRGCCCAERGEAKVALGAAGGPGACLPGLRPHAPTLQAGRHSMQAVSAVLCSCRWPACLVAAAA
jgi:hypothetical protein